MISRINLVINKFPLFIKFKYQVQALIVLADRF